MLAWGCAWGEVSLCCCLSSPSHSSTVVSYSVSTPSWAEGEADESRSPPAQLSQAELTGTWGNMPGPPGPLGLTDVLLEMLASGGGGRSIPILCSPVIIFVVSQLRSKGIKEGGKEPPHRLFACWWEPALAHPTEGRRCFIYSSRLLLFSPIRLERGAGGGRVLCENSRAEVNPDFTAVCTIQDSTTGNDRGGGGNGDTVRNGQGEVGRLCSARLPKSGPQKVHLGFS